LASQGTALGIFALGNIGITVGMMAVTFLVTRVLYGPDGWRLIFPIFAIATLLMALVQASRDILPTPTTYGHDRSTICSRPV
jgi:nitrate/nitrite transporter NarK